MSEELRAKGYLKKGEVSGDRVGQFEGFNLGGSTLSQLSKAGIIPAKVYGAVGNAKPDGLVVDRRGGQIVTKAVIEHKDAGELGTPGARAKIIAKVAETYCQPLACLVAILTDGSVTYWYVVDPESTSWRPVMREDGYPLDTPADLSSIPGRDALAKALSRIDEELDPITAVLRPVAAVNPTSLAEQTWQTIWLASGENPDACLATFVELLIFKFLSDLALLAQNPDGVRVNFDHVLTLDKDKALPFYFKHVRPEIKRLFPPSSDGASVINGIVLDPENLDHSALFSQILQRFEALGTLRRIDHDFKSRIFEKFLKKSISQKNWGQFFTPRNVVKAIESPRIS